MRRSVTLQEFRANSDNPVALKSFLDSALGQLVVAALETHSPVRKLGATAQNNSANNLRAAAAGESDGGSGRAENLLGRIEGHESSLDFLCNELTQLPKEDEGKKSKKAGGEGTKPAPLPPT